MDILFSTCNACGKRLAISTDHCIHCGEKDPFGKALILQLGNKITTNTILRPILCFPIGIVAFFSALYFHSVIIAIVAIVVIFYIVSECNSKIKDASFKIMSPFNKSYKNFVLENKSNLNPNTGINWAYGAYCKNLLKMDPAYLPIGYADWTEIDRDIYGTPRTHT